MATAITGAVNYTASIQAIDAASRLGCGCVDATETYAYYPDRVNRRIFRLNIAAGTFTSLYGNTFQLSGFTITSLAFMPDGITLIGFTQNVAGTFYVYTFLADGSSGSPTQVMTYTTPAIAFDRVRYDPITGFSFVSNGAAKLLYYIIPGVWSAPDYYFSFYNRFVSDVIPSRYDPDKILVASTTNNSQQQLCELSKRSGMARVIAGNGSNSAASTGPAYTTPVGSATHMDSDGDGRVYYGSGTAVYSLIDGTIAQINAVNYSAQAGIIFLPINNRLLVCNATYEVRRLQ